MISSVAIVLYLYDGTYVDMFHVSSCHGFHDEHYVTPTIESKESSAPWVFFQFFIFKDGLIDTVTISCSLNCSVT